MKFEKTQLRESGYSVDNSDKFTSKKTLNYSASGFSEIEVINDPEWVQRLGRLLKAHETLLQTTIRRTEAFQLKPFPRYLNQKEVISYLGHEKIFSILVEEYGLKPIRQEHKCNIYCSKQVEERCIQFEHNIAL